MPVAAAAPVQRGAHDRRIQSRFGAATGTLRCKDPQGLRGGARGCMRGPRGGGQGHEARQAAQEAREICIRRLLPRWPVGRCS
eukprot:8315787-Pyramimonas_sp.AAC.1